VYIDAFQGRLPQDVDILLRTTRVFHSTVTEVELAATIGHLDPADKRTRAYRQDDLGLARSPSAAQNSHARPRRHGVRRRSPAASSRGLQRYATADRRRTLNDALNLFHRAQAR